MYHSLIRPGYFCPDIAADTERMNYDYHNDALLANAVIPDFLFIGDSITQYWDLETFFGRDKILVNRGIGGDKPEYILRRFDADCVQLSPRYVVLMCGTNVGQEMEDNIWVGTRGLTLEECVDKTVCSLEELFDYGIEREMNLIIGTIPPTTAPFNAALRNPMIREVNEFIRTYCKEHQIIMVDYYRALADPVTKTLRSDLTTDGIHPHAKGFRIMADTLRKTLSKYDIII